jgi:hypothetical protein
MSEGTTEQADVPTLLLDDRVLSVLVACVSDARDGAATTRAGSRMAVTEPGSTQ